MFEWGYFLQFKEENSFLEPTQLLIYDTMNIHKLSILQERKKKIQVGQQLFMGFSTCQHIWKFSSGHKTGKGQFPFQSQRKVMPKYVQTIAQLHSFHTLANYCSKVSKLGLNSPWINSFQMFKLNLEKAEEAEIKFCQHPLEHRKTKRIPEKHLFLLHWPYQSLWLCGSWQTLENS